jgi:hypothetical protein
MTIPRRSEWKTYRGTLHIRAVALRGCQLYLEIKLSTPPPFLPRQQWVKCTFND